MTKAVPKLTSVTDIRVMGGPAVHTILRRSSGSALLRFSTGPVGFFHWAAAGARPDMRWRARLWRWITRRRVPIPTGAICLPAGDALLLRSEPELAGRECFVGGPGYGRRTVDREVIFEAL